MCFLFTVFATKAMQTYIASFDARLTEIHRLNLDKIQFSYNAFMSKKVISVAQYIA